MGYRQGRLTDPAGSLLLAVAYGAGLTTGLSRFPDPLVVAAAGVAVVIVLRHPPIRALACTLVLGVVIGAVTRQRADSSCAAILRPGVGTLTVTLVDPGLASGRVRVRSPTCHGLVKARWPDGRALPAGATAEVSARWVPRPGPLDRPDGSLNVRRIETTWGSGGIVARSRNAAADRIGWLFGERAPLVDALLVGNQGGLDADLRQQFAEAGLIHLLVISGSHIGLVAAWVVMLLATAGLPQTWSLRAGALVGLAYAGWLGWPAPATRAAVLLVVVVVGRWTQRRWRPDGALGVTLLAVLAIDPWAITRVGAWLSFVALGGVLWANRWAKSWWPGMRPPVDAVIASIGATLTTAPISAQIFGQVAPIGVVLNLAAVPLAALLVPALGGAVFMASVFPAMAAALAASSGLLLDALVALGVWGSELPGAGTPGEASLARALPWLVLLLTIHLVTRRRTTPRESARRVVWIGAVAALASAVLPLPGALATSSGDLTIAFLAVGQGDAAVVRTPHGRWVVVDAGPRDERYDAGKRVVVPYLKRHGAQRVDLFVLSHGHSDHAGGAPALFDAIEVDLVLDPADPAAEASYHEFLQAVVEAGIPWRAGRAGEQFAIDGVVFRVLHPTPGWSGEGRDLNEDSIVLEVRYGAFTALLAGDAGIAAERAYMQTLGPVDLLKVGHHGSRTATGQDLLRAVRPEVGVISLGVNNYGHPAPETMARLAQAQVAVWRTDREGVVTLTTDGRTFRVRSRDRTAVFDATDP